MVISQKKVYVCTTYTCIHEYKCVFMCLHVYSREYDYIQTQRSEQTPLVYIATDSLRHNSHIQCVNLGVCHGHLKMTHKWSIQYCWDSNIWRQSNIYLNSSLFKRNKQKNSMTLSHISSCRIPSYGVMWICHMVSCGFVLDQVWVPLLSYGVMWSHVGARRRFSSLWSDWKSKKYCGDGHPRVSESG